MIMQKKILTLIVLLITAATGAWAQTTVTITPAKIEAWYEALWEENPDDAGIYEATSITIDGVTITANGDIYTEYIGNPGTFSISSGNFTKIVARSTTEDIWVTWTGSAASTVVLLNEVSFFSGAPVTSIVFTLE